MTLGRQIIAVDRVTIGIPRVTDPRKYLCYRSGPRTAIFAARKYAQGYALLGTERPEDGDDGMRTCSTH